MKSASPLQLAIVSSETDFDALAPEWERLFDACGLSVFQSFAWNRSWWRHLAPAGASQLHLVTVRAGATLVAIAPLFFEDVGALGLRVRRLSFLGREDSDYLDIMAIPARRAEVIDVLAGHLVDRADLFDAAMLEDIPDRSTTVAGLVESLARRGMPTQVFANERCPRTALRATWDETLAGWKQEHRRELRRRRRNLEKAAQVELEVGGDPSTVDDDIEDFISMHQERWTGVGRKGALAGQATQRFHREVAQAFALRGWAFLGFLRVDGRRLGVVYGFRFRDELAIYLTGMRDVGALARHSPGRVLAGLCMENAVAHGASTYDFMRGSEQYKYELEAVDILNRTVSFQGCRGAFAPQRHRAVLLGQSLQRRAHSEILLWRHVSRSASVAHVRARLGAVLRDGWAKVKAPERSLSAPRDAPR